MSSTSSIAASNLTSGFIDLATYDELEKYMYGGIDATAYFVRQTRRSTWFTQVPVILSRASGTPGFGNDWSVSISRAGDYLLYSWLRVTLPTLQAALVASTQTKTIDGVSYSFQVDYYLAWTPNLLHNLVREAAVTFNDLVAARFDNYQLDFWSAFTVPAGKQVGYANMIGMTADLIEPKKTLVGKVLNLPLPFFYARDSGVALPTAALPYNEMRINFSFRNLNELLTTWEQWTPLATLGSGTTATTIAPIQTFYVIRSYQTGDLNTSITNFDLTNVQVWSNYAIVSNDERKRMACAPRDILIEQVQTAPVQSFVPYNNPNQSFDIRFSHAIKVLFFAVRNTTVATYWSNYTTRTPTVVSTIYPSSGTTGTAASAPSTLILDSPFPGVDPIGETSLIYENTQRLANMGSDYFSLVEPYYAAPVIPIYVGYHLYSYSLDFLCLDPLGSTNYGKLTNVSIIPYASTDARCVNQSPPVNNATQQFCTGSPVEQQQTFTFIVTAVNNNVIRISGGALGFPVL